MDVRRHRKPRMFESLEGRLVLDSTVVFNELMFNPASSAENVEWIELHNQMAIPMDISAWTLRDGVQFKFPSGTVIPGGGYLVVAANPTALASATGYSGAVGPWTGQLSNAGERVQLVSNADRIMDEIEYSDSGDWPVGPDGSGATLAKIDPLSGTALPSNWRTSAQIGGTPGTKNFPTSNQFNVPTGVVSYWNFNEASGPALDNVGGNSGALGAGVSRVPGAIGSGAVQFNDTSSAAIDVGAGAGNNFSTTSGVAIESLIKPTWDGTGNDELFRKTESPGATLVSYWNFNETDTGTTADAPDLVGTNHGTFLGGVTRVTPGVVGAGAASFNDGASQGIIVGTGGAANTFSTTTGISLGAWIKPLWSPSPGVTSYDEIFRKNDGNNRILFSFQNDTNNAGAQIPVTAGLPVLSFGLNTGGYKELDMPLGVNLSALTGGNPSSGTIYLNAPPTTPGPNDVVLKDGNAHYVSAKYDKSTGEKAIYVDGVKRWSQVVAGAPTIISGGGVAAYIGNTLGFGEAFNGVIDEMVFYNTARTDAQMALLASGAAPSTFPGLVSHWSFDQTPNPNANVAIDSVGPNNGTFAGTASHTTGLVGLGAARIRNASGDGVNVGAGVGNSFSVTKGITLSTFIKPEWSGAVSDWDEIFRKEDGGNRILLSFQNDNNGGGATPPVANGPALSFGLNVGGVYSELDMPLDGASGRPTLAQLKDGASHHIAATYDAATGKKAIYIDGVERFATTLSGNITSGGAAAAMIGNDAPGGGEPYSGVIDDLSFWNGALGAAQIAQLAVGTLPTNVTSTGGPGDRIHLGFQNDGNNAAANPPVAAGPVLSFGLNVGGVYSELDMPLDGAAGRPTLAQLKDGAVHHVVATYDQVTGKKAIFIDGTERYSTTLAGPITSGGSSAATIGNSASSGADAFSGVIDEMAFWKKSLSAAEVSSHWTEVQAGRNYFAPLNPGQISTADLAFNEQAAGGAGYWVEIVNRSASPVQIGGYVIASPAGAGVHYVLPAQLLPAGGYAVVTAAQLGYTPNDTDRLFLLNPTEQVVIDAIAVDNELRGRYPDSTGRWMFPTTATPGAANSFNLHNEIVINEIMYHDRATSATPGTPATYQTTKLIALDAATTWQYNPNTSNAGFASGWANSAHPAGAGGWLSGAAPIGYETDATLIAQLRTTLANPATATPFVRTYYFERTFNVADPTTIDLLQISHLTDDGAVFYLNGHEVLRYNMPGNPGDPVAPADIAPTGIDNATTLSGVTIDKSWLVPGSNRLSVEVHQAGATTSSDIVFGVELLAQVVVSPAIPGTPYTESDEEWVELYNKSGAAVDLSGWQLNDAIDYTFAAGTSIAPGEYLVIAKDPVALGAKYPSIRILGSYSGTLSNTDDNLELLDAHKNIADEVHYYSNGRWSEFADGGGSSLELRDPDADNSAAEAWGASDESAKSDWVTYTYTGIASQFPNSNNPRTYNEFSLGLLTAGEVLLDDIHVIENPSGAHTELLQNTGFQSDTVGASAATWRVVGDHHGTVILDPTNNANKVLRVAASFPEEHMENHAETTLKKAGVQAVIQLGTEYEISYKAKWITGSNQLNSRLFFNILPKTTILQVPDKRGTPGAKNSVLGATSTAAANVGPTYSNFAHGPTVPSANQPITVTANAADPQGVASMVVKYSVNGGAWQSAAMTGSAGKYTGTIPGQAALAVVQFYVEGTDTAGAVSTYPGGGVNSRAIVRVAPGIALSQTLQNIQILMTPADAALLGASTNLMSNDRLGATVIYQDKVFYDVDVRLKGSEHGRPDVNRRGFFIDFHPDELFRGVQETVAIDRSGGWAFGRQFGQDEIVVLQYMNRAGNLPVQLSDLVYVDAPGVPTGTAILQMSRFTDVFLDNQFEDGGDGMLYEYELIYTMLESAGAETLKYAQEGPSVFGINVGSNMGDDKEAYRHNFLIKDNRARDDYQPMITLAKTLSLSGAGFNAQSAQVLDLDEWMRAFAAMTLSGAGDNYQSGAQHNGVFYQRPSDGKMLLFPFDMDFAFYQASNSPLVSNSDLSKMLTVPNNAHAFYGHLQDIISVSYNRDYLDDYIASYNALLPGQDFSSILNYVDARRSFALSQLPASVNFQVTTPSGGTVNTPTTTVQGNGWVNVRTIRVNGQQEPIPVTWTSTTAWTATVQLQPGQNTLQFQAFDFQGNPISTPVSNTITITSDQPRPLIDNLRVSEVMYHPGDPSAAEQLLGYTNADDFEFIEFVNISATESLPLAGAKISGGVDFTFPAVNVAPGGRVVVVKNQDAFTARYGTTFHGTPIVVAGEYDNQLNNSGEGLSIYDSFNGIVQIFGYDDTGEGWQPSTDGDGYSLVIVNELGPVDSWNDGPSWRASYAIGGSPGSPDTPSLDGDVNGDSRVDLLDLAILQSHLGVTSGGLRSEGDLNGDGAINRADAALLARNYGKFTPAPSPAAGAIVARVPAEEHRTSPTAAGQLLARRRAVVVVPAAVDAALGSALDSAQETGGGALRARRVLRASQG